MQGDKEVYRNFDEMKYFLHTMPMREQGRLSERKTRMKNYLSIAMLLSGLAILAYNLLNISTFINSESIFDNGLFLSFILIMQGLNFFILQNASGNEYIKIDNQGLEIKKNYYSRKKSINWNEISKIEINLLNILIYKTNGKKEKISLGWASYLNLKIIKEKLSEICRKQNINLGGI